MDEEKRWIDDLSQTIGQMEGRFVNDNCVVMLKKIATHCQRGDFSTAKGLAEDAWPLLESGWYEHIFISWRMKNPLKEHVFAANKLARHIEKVEEILITFLRVKPMVAH